MNQYRFVRAIIGLPQTYKFSNQTVEISYNETDTKKKITRFENPIHFKPYGNYLLIIPQRIPQRMFDNNLFRLDNREITTPTSDSFRLTDFLEFCHDEYKNNLDDLKTRFDPDHTYFKNVKNKPKIPLRVSKPIFESLNRITSIEKAEPKAGDEHNG